MVVVDERPVGMTKGNDGGNFLDLLSLVCHVWHPQNMLEGPACAGHHRANRYLGAHRCGRYF